MKVSKEQLKALIKEELDAVMKEVSDTAMDAPNTPKTVSELRSLLQNMDPGCTISLRHPEGEGCAVIFTNLSVGKDGETLTREPTSSTEVRVMKEVFGANTGKKFDPNNRLDTTTRDTPLTTGEKIRKAVGLGTRKELTPDQVNRIYAAPDARPSTGKFSNEYSAYANYRRDPKTGKMVDDMSDIDVANSSVKAARQPKITRTTSNAMEEGSELEEARSPTAALDSLVGQELPLFGIIVSDRTFKLGDQVFKAVEDPEDGYRSSLRSIVAVSAARNAKRNKFSAEPLATVRVEKLDQQGEEWSTDAFDGYALIDAETGHQWLRVGTAAPDDYYPAFEFDTQTPEDVSSYGSDIEGIKNIEDLKALDIASDEFDVIRKGQIAAARKAGEKVKPVDRNKEIDKLVKEEDKQMEQISESFRRFTKILKD
jgi:hypothetical protein